jgi:hypothetical protein
MNFCSIQTTKCNLSQNHLVLKSVSLSSLTVTLSSNAAYFVYIVVDLDPVVSGTFWQGRIQPFLHKNLHDVCKFFSLVLE